MMALAQRTPTAANFVCGDDCSLHTGPSSNAAAHSEIQRSARSVTSATNTAT
jgi:hypothetical protein